MLQTSGTTENGAAEFGKYVSDSLQIVRRPGYNQIDVFG
jgi:hypothetical protein